MHSCSRVFLTKVACRVQILSNRKAGASGWRDLFSSDDAQLLDYEDYRLKVTKLGPKTSITFMDNESTPFDAKQVADLFKPFEQVMTEDGLDI